jgi:chromosome partitioning protein
VLNGVPSRGAKRAQAEEVVRGLAIPICPAAFGYRAAFNDSGALGLTAYEYEPGGKAALEIEQVYTFVSKLVKELPSEQGGNRVKESHRPASRHA